MQIAQWLEHLVDFSGGMKPEWQNLPYREFLGQKTDGELVYFHFRDVDTEEVRIVEQLY